MARSRAGPGRGQAFGVGPRWAGCSIGEGACGEKSRAVREVSLTIGEKGITWQLEGAWC